LSQVKRHGNRAQNYRSACISNAYRPGASPGGANCRRACVLPKRVKHAQELFMALVISSTNILN
jgi:hypothetical protein